MGDFEPLASQSAPLLKVLAVQSQWLAVDKPAGLLSVPGRGDDKQDCASSRVQALWPDALVVHRLDMATSGVLLMARGRSAQRALGAAFAARTVKKRYIAVVAGLVGDDAGCIDLPLSADWPNRPLQRVDLVGGKPAATHYTVLGRSPTGSSTRLQLMPVTGRSHQLRVHLLALGHPIVGDCLYAPSVVAAAAPRLLLHAASLAFEGLAGEGPEMVESVCPF